MPRTILVVDDSTINRRILRKILDAEYAVIEAENGQDAIGLLIRSHRQISAVLLDLVMPVMDGYAVLDKMRSNPALAQIPVIVTTGYSDEETEERALALGATDYVAKPYAANIILRRLQNLIRLRETSAMVNAYQKDKLTGLWNRDTFMEKARSAVQRRHEGYYILSSVDINGFKVINDQYGTDKGDEVLRGLASLLKRECDANGGLCGRVAGDNFVALYPRSLLNPEDDEQARLKAIPLPGVDLTVTVSVGRCVVDDKRLSVNALYNRALIAQRTVKGRFDRHVAMYDEAMGKKLVREQEIINVMNGALASGQFEAWIQPQYNHSTGDLVGGEALARWRHPEWGMVSPGEFIPVFERNGFVYELDRCIWEQVCALLRRWMDEGIDPPPISVNISRYDLLNEDLPETVAALTEKYAIPRPLLRLEVTESAFEQSASQVVSAVKRLVEMGFTVEIDDFGSGYSSLNTLKDVPAQIIKLDMRFLEGSDNLDRSGSIIESVVRMSNWLGMSVIAEGVERHEQADFLKSVGCSFVQGYLYARPMPASEFEAQIRGAGREKPLLGRQASRCANAGALWNPESAEALAFSAFAGAACILEYRDGEAEMLRANEKLPAMLGGGVTLAEALRLPWKACIDASDARKRADALRSAVETGEEVCFEANYRNLLGDGRDFSVRTFVRAAAAAGDRYLLLCRFEDVTAQREAEERLRRADEELGLLKRRVGEMSVREEKSRALRETMPVILSAIMKSSNDLAFAKDRNFNYICCSPGFVRFARQRTEADVIGKSDYDFWTKEEADRFRRDDEKLFAGGESLIDFMEAIPSDDGIQHYSVTSKYILRDSSGEIVGLYGLGRDVTDTRVALDQLRLITDNIPGGIASFSLSPSGLKMEYYSDGVFSILGYSGGEYAALNRGDPLALVHPEDMSAVAAGLNALKMGEAETEYTFRARAKDGGERWISAHCAVQERRGDLIKFNAVQIDVTAQREAEQKRREIAEQMRVIMENVTSGIVATAFDGEGLSRNIFANDQYYAMLGYTRQQFDAECASPMEAVLPEDRPEVQKTVGRLLLEGGSAVYEYRCVKRSGEIIWVRNHNSVSTIGSAEGRVLLGVLNDATGDKARLDRQRADAEEYRLAAEGGGRLIYRYNHGDNSVDLTEKVAPVFGLPTHLTDVPESLLAGGVVAPECVEPYRAFFRAIRRGDKTGGMTIRRRTADGDWHWYSAAFSNVFDPDGKPVSAMIVFEDVTDQQEKESIYAKWRQSLKEKSPKDYTLLRWNVNKNAPPDSREGSLIRYSAPADTPIDERIREYSERYVHPEDRGAFQNFADAERLLSEYQRGIRAKSLEYRETQEDGSERWLRVTAELVKYPNSADVQVYMMHENIDAAKRGEIRVREQAERDPLTGVLNRATFAAKADEARRGMALNAKFALMMLDVDGFKILNDTFGHAAGDQALIDMAGALRAMLRKGDLLGRLGGDEFVVGLVGMSGDADIENKARQICATLKKAYSPKVRTSVSIGIAVSPRDGTRLDDIYRRADQALYSVKNAQKGGYAFYRSDMGEWDERMDGPERGESTQKPKPEAAKRRVLIVDDNRMDLEALSAMLRDAYAVETAADGPSALALLRHDRTAIDLALLDLFMPEMDGFDVLERMGEDAELKTIPVIVVSASGDRETALRAIRSGAADYITKPADPQILRVRIQSAISRAENERLRAQNGFLSLQGTELIKYRTALESTNTAVIEYDWKNGVFAYDSSVTRCIAGNFDGRRLWNILLSDFAASVMDVAAMQSLVHEIAGDRERTGGGMMVTLKTPNQAKHRFRMNVTKLPDKYRLTDKLILAFTDLDQHAFPQSSPGLQKRP